MYFLFLLCLAGLVLLTAILSLLSSIIQKWVGDTGSKSDEEEGAPNHEQSDPEQLQPEIPTIASVSSVNRIAGAIDSYRNKRDSHERKKSETDKVNIVVLSVTALFAFIAAGAAVVSGWIFYGQLEEMQAEQRAWITVDTNITGDLVFLPTPKIGLKITLKNEGKSPALDSWIYVSLYPYVSDTNTVEMKRRCVKMREDYIKNISPENPSRAGYVTYPNHQINFVSNPAISHDDIERWRKAKIWPMLLLNLVVCADYRLSKSSEIHSTELLYAIGTTEKNKRFNNLILGTDNTNLSEELNLIFDGRDQVIGKDKLRLYLDPNGGSEIY